MNEVKQATTGAFKKGQRSKEKLNTSLSGLSEGMKAVSAKAKKDATNVFQNYTSFSELSEGLKVVSAESKQDATNVLQQISAEVKNQIYSPWMHEGIKSNLFVKIILGNN